MNTGILIIVVAVLGIIFGIVEIQKSFEGTIQYTIEKDSEQKIKQVDIDDDFQISSFTIIMQKDAETGNENFCDHAHLAVDEYWYYAKTYNNNLLNSNLGTPLHFMN